VCVCARHTGGKLFVGIIVLGCLLFALEASEIYSFMKSDAILVLLLGGIVTNKLFYNIPSYTCTPISSFEMQNDEASD
jgi:hypothetical protein